MCEEEGSKKEEEERESPDGDPPSLCWSRRGLPIRTKLPCWPTDRRASLTLLVAGGTKKLLVDTSISLLTEPLASFRVVEVAKIRRPLARLGSRFGSRCRRGGRSRFLNQAEIGF